MSKDVVTIPGTEIEIDENGQVALVNDTDFDESAIQAAIVDQYPELANLDWARSPFAESGARRKTVFEQNRYVAPGNIFAEFDLAAYAAKYDDVVANAAATTENLAFKRVALEVDDDKENDIWAQIADELDLPQRMREMWREQFIYSQFYYAILWHTKDYKVKRKIVDAKSDVESDGDKPKTTRRPKKVFKKIKVPKGITILDPRKVVPVGNFMFNQERLVYIAANGEEKGIRDSLDVNNREATDEIVRQLFEKPWNPSAKELADIRELTGDSSIQRGRLFLLNRDNVFRQTATRPAYEKFADVRMASLFEILDLKHLLREMDRSEILSATNCIILVKKGTDALPAKKGELAAAAASVSKSSRVPLIVSDHRLEIEIITRKTDKVLMAERYNGLDSRLTAGLYNLLSTGNYSAGTATDNSTGLFKVMSASMEARRDNIRDSLITNVINKIWEKNDELKDPPSMNFYPRRIALDFDNNISLFMQDLKDRNIISAETLLAEMDIVLEEEVGKIKREMDKYPDILMQYQVPYSATTTPGKPHGPEAAPKPAATPAQAAPTPRAAGRAGGGNKNGGGTNPASSRPSPNNVGK